MKALDEFLFDRFYRVADVSGRHWLGVVVDVVELAVDEIVVGALTGADAMIDVVKR